MAGRIITGDAERKHVELFHESGADHFVIENKQDVQDLVDFNKHEFDSNTNRWGDGRIVARIPMTTVIELQRRGIWDDEQALLKWIDREGVAYKCVNASLSK
jgi:hypothetical protein